MFYAPWCGHCQEAKPQWISADAYLKEHHGIHLYAIDCDDNKNRPICYKYEVNGFPTIKLFRPSNLEKPVDYTGKREAQHFAHFFMNYKLNPIQEKEKINLQEILNDDPNGNNSGEAHKEVLKVKRGMHVIRRIS